MNSTLSSKTLKVSPGAALLRKLNERLLEICEGRGRKQGEIFDLDRDFNRLIVHSGAGSAC